MTFELIHWQPSVLRKSILYTHRCTCIHSLSCSSCLPGIHPHWPLYSWELNSLARITCKGIYYSVWIHARACTHTLTHSQQTNKLKTKKAKKKKNIQKTTPQLQTLTTIHTEKQNQKWVGENPLVILKWPKFGRTETKTKPRILAFVYQLYSLDTWEKLYILPTPIGDQVCVKSWRVTGVCTH